MRSGLPPIVCTAGGLEIFYDDIKCARYRFPILLCFKLLLHRLPLIPDLCLMCRAFNAKALAAGVRVTEIVDERMVRAAVRWLPATAHRAVICPSGLILPFVFPVCLALSSTTTRSLCRISGKPPTPVRNRVFACTSASIPQSRPCARVC